MSATAAFTTAFRPKLKRQRVRQWSQIKLLDDVSPWVPDCVLRISEFARLPQDWDSHGSDPVTSSALKAALTFLSQSPLELVPEPSVSPVSGGGLGFHWRCDGRDLEIEFLPDGRAEYLKTLKAGEHVESVEGTITTFHEKSLWNWLAGELA
jgi:hypothetical protein